MYVYKYIYIFKQSDRQTDKWPAKEPLKYVKDTFHADLEIH